MIRHPPIAVLGTGLMGAPMARNLLKAGYPVTVWNRTGHKALALEADGARPAPHPGAAVDGASIIISMVSDGRAVSALINDPQLQASLSKGTIWLDMSSIMPREARRHAATLHRLGCGHLDAPVSGGTRGAANASLAIMVGGPAEHFEAARPVMEAMGRAIHVGASGTGQLAKLANQAIVAITIGAVAEATLLVERGDADPAAMRDALTGGFADSVILQQHGARMSDRDFVPGGPAKFHLKDLDNLLTEATELGLELPLSQQMRDRFADLCSRLGGGDLDHSGLYLELSSRNEPPEST